MPVKRDMSHVHLKRGIVNLKLGRYINRWTQLFERNYFDCKFLYI